MTDTSIHPTLEIVQAWAAWGFALENLTRWQMYHAMHAERALDARLQTPQLVGGWTPDNPPEYEYGDEYPIEIIY